MSAAEALGAPAETALKPEWIGLKAGSFPTRSDKASLALIGLTLLLLLAGWRGHGPSMVDTWYHLALADQALQRGGVPLWDDWEFAPYGRPNLYPPVLHIMLAGVGAVTGGVLNAGTLFAIAFMPLGMLANWLLARRLLNDRVAFLAVVFMLLDMAHVVIMRAYIASCLVNILMPPLLLAVIRRRGWVAIGMLTTLYYTHLGFPHVMALGLLLFGVVERSYLRVTLKVVGISFLFWTPWLAHVCRHWEWVSHVFSGGGMPGPLIFKILALQFVNLFVITCGIIGARRLWRLGGAYRIVPCMLVGFLPILFSYGGRYLMHTLPLWSIAGAVAAQGILPEGSTRLRHLLLALCALLPAPTFVFGEKPSPMPLTSAHLLLAMPLNGGTLGEEERSERYLEDCDQLADWLRTHTTPEDVIHTNKEWVADAITLLAGRRTDSGPWWECGNDRWKRYNRAWRDGRESAVFVALKPRHDAGSIFHETPAMPGMDETIEIGRFLVGLRRVHRLTHAADAPLRDIEPVRVVGVSGRVELGPAGRPAVWTVPEGSRDRVAVIEMPLPLSHFEGVEVRLRSDRVEPLHLGLRLAGGAEERFEIVLPMENEWHVVRVPRAWMERIGQPAEGAAVEGMYLSWVSEEKLPPRQVEVHHVHLLREE